ncbi:MAG: putative sugar kinase [Firmicutes bacterium]|nr:putative sugar kinase [Bacillota bacterium]
MNNIYLYGSILATDSFILEGEFPDGNQYAEYVEHHTHIGGETGVAMAILASYGIPVKGDGYHQGTYTMPILEKFFQNTDADLSALTVRDDFEGFHDYVYIDRINNTRNCIGPFGSIPKRFKEVFNMPCEEDVAIARIVSIDPFQDEGSRKTAEYAVKHSKPYVTIDCGYDSYLAKHCAVAAISDEFLSVAYPGEDHEVLLNKYMAEGNGLYIFTFGSHKVLYGRGGVIKQMEPFHVKALSTLGAGDTFRSGCLYGLYMGMSDDEIVDFSCAIAACACQVYPLAENLPTLKAVKNMQRSRK